MLMGRPAERYSPISYAQPSYSGVIIASQRTRDNVIVRDVGAKRHAIHNGLSPPVDSCWSWSLFDL